MADNEARQGEQETGPYAEAHPDRPNSGEAPIEMEVTEEALEAARVKSYRSAGGANPQGPVTDLTFGDLQGQDALQSELDEMDEEIENQDDPRKRALRSAERDMTANRLYKLKADAEANADISEGVERVGDPGDARGQLATDDDGETQRRGREQLRRSDVDADEKGQAKGDTAGKEQVSDEVRTQPRAKGAPKGKSKS